MEIIAVGIQQEMKYRRVTEICLTVPQPPSGSGVDDSHRVNSAFRRGQGDILAIYFVPRGAFRGCGILENLGGPLLESASDATCHLQSRPRGFSSARATIPLYKSLSACTRPKSDSDFYGSLSFYGNDCESSLEGERHRSQVLVRQEQTTLFINAEQMSRGLFLTHRRSGAKGRGRADHHG